MSISLKNLLMSNAPLKIISLILGYTSWLLLGTIHTHTAWHKVPLSFYDIADGHIINAPETVDILLSGTRSHLRSLNPDTLAIHLNGSHLTKGTQPITITAEQLFLPPSIKLVHHTPATIMIELS